MEKKKKKNHVFAPCAIMLQILTYDNHGGFPLTKFFHHPTTHSMDIYWALIMGQALSVCVCHLGKRGKETDR